jgi:MFS family permease
MQSISLQPARSIVTSPDYIRNTRFILTLSFIGMILGGVIAGYFSQKRGWIAGILVGLVSISFSLILLLCSLLFKDVIFTSKIPDKLVNIKLMASFIQILKSIPTTLFCTALGGYIGEMIWQRKSHK